MSEPDAEPVALALVLALERDVESVGLVETDSVNDSVPLHEDVLVIVTLDVFDTLDDDEEVRDALAALLPLGSEEPDELPESLREAV